MDLDPITQEIAALCEQIEQATAVAESPDCTPETLEALERLRRAAQKQINEATAVLHVAKALDALTEELP